MRFVFVTRDRVSAKPYTSVWLLLHRMQKMAKCERFNISLENHKTNYKLTLLLRWLVCFLNLVMRFAVYLALYFCELWAHDGPERMWPARETFATNGKDKREIFVDNKGASRASSRNGGRRNVFVVWISVQFWVKPEIGNRRFHWNYFVVFVCATVNRPHFKFPHRKYRIVSGLVHFWKVASARRNSKRLLLSIREFTGNGQRWTPLCVLTTILLRHSNRLRA